MNIPIGRSPVRPRPWTLLPYSCPAWDKCKKSVYYPIGGNGKEIESDETQIPRRYRTLKLRKTLGYLQGGFSMVPINSGYSTCGPAPGMISQHVYYNIDEVDFTSRAD